jgi:[ribosomal protein S5]-alanine N-acetyltransferase
MPRAGPEQAPSTPRACRGRRPASWLVQNLRMVGPERIETARLVLRRPRASDAAAIFARYASDPEVTRWLGWPRHASIADTEGFLAFSAAEWTRAPAGAYLIEARDDGALLGSTGFGFETPSRAMTGYLLARDAWGRGYATEALAAIVDLAPRLGVVRLHAQCHADHGTSTRVLEKCGFTREGLLRRYAAFPNSGVDGPLDTLIYARIW